LASHMVSLHAATRSRHLRTVWIRFLSHRARNEELISLLFPFDFETVPRTLEYNKFLLSCPGGIVFIQFTASTSLDARLKTIYAAAKSATGRCMWFGDGVSSFRQLLLALLICLATVGPAVLLAQSDNSSIAGTITDPSGAVVGNASITVTSELTGVEHKTVSNRSGFYTIAGLAPGNIRLLRGRQRSRLSPRRITILIRLFPLRSIFRFPSARRTNRSK
jgi:hypothetical protein